ncbi:alpha/beta hydrolase [Roseomonas sp. AR75]|uniref:alpha/beta hydrolase n=1 Tax=Roseomonas sp. AR75 TaxID=2562311 RepID=UPI0010BFF91F|nr:alpha/beta hydrolase [Roseomonas sp. AR75]
MLRRLLAGSLPRLLDSGAPMRLAALMTPRAGAEEVRGLRYGAGPRRLLDLTLPRGATAATPLLVFFHGGGWQTGSRADYAFLARAFAAEGIAVALPDYRLWPQARWPDFLADGAAALAWLRGAPTVPRGPLFVMGHSAGGFIAAALALDPRWQVRQALAGAVLVSAPIAWQPTDEPIRSIFAPAPGGRIEAMPDSAAMRGAPPLLLIHGTADTVVGPFHSERLAEGVAEAGGTARLVMMEGAGHIAPMVALSAPARRFGWAKPAAWHATLGFLRDYSG